MSARRWASSTATGALGMQTANACTVPWKTPRPGANFVTCSYGDSFETSSISYFPIFLRTLRAKWQTSSTERLGIYIEGKITPS
jgi:hypothetical protein